MSDSDAPPAVRLGFGKKLLFSLVVLVLLLGMAEACCRVAGVGRPEEKPRWDADWRQVELTAPDGRRSLYREKIVAGASTRVNSGGFRDWEFDDGTEGEIRVAALGDSFVYGQGVAEDRIWVRRLESLLNRDGKRRVRVMNFGVLGANTARQLATLVEHVLPLSPRLVVLSFTLYNDAETDKEYRAAGAKRKARESKTSQRVIRWVHEHSWFVHYVVSVLRRGRNRRSMDQHIRRQYADDAPGFRECRRSLLEIRDLCRQRDIPLIVMLFPIHFDDVVMNDWSEYTLRDVHRKIRGIVEGPGVTFVDLIDGLEPLEGKKIWVSGDRHPNALYHQRVAEILAPIVSGVLEKGD